MEYNISTSVKLKCASPLHRFEVRTKSVAACSVATPVNQSINQSIIILGKFSYVASNYVAENSKYKFIPNVPCLLLPYFPRSFNANVTLLRIGYWYYWTVISYTHIKLLVTPRQSARVSWLWQSEKDQQKQIVSGICQEELMDSAKCLGVAMVHLALIYIYILNESNLITVHERQHRPLKGYESTGMCF